MAATRVAILNDYQGAALGAAPWATLGEDVEVVAFADHVVGDALIARLTRFDVIVAMRERTAFPADVLTCLPRLRLLVTTGPRNAAIDVEAARAQGVFVCGTGGTAHPTAELTWGLILALARHVLTEDRALRDGLWQTTVGTDLRGRTLGVLGLGHLGSRVAKVGLAFGMRVVAWSQHLTDERAAEVGVERVEREALFARADVLSVHLVLSERTRGLVGERELAQMQTHALLVNTSRGPIVDEAALVAALVEGRLGGAALDVFDVEPLPADHPYRTMPRTILPPHLGYVTGDTYEIFFRHALENIAAFLAGTPIRELGQPW